MENEEDVVKIGNTNCFESFTSSYCDLCSFFSFSPHLLCLSVCHLGLFLALFLLHRRTLSIASKSLNTRQNIAKIQFSPDVCWIFIFFFHLRRIDPQYSMHYEYLAFVCVHSVDSVRLLLASCFKLSFVLSFFFVVVQMEIHVNYRTLNCFDLRFSPLYPLFYLCHSSPLSQ